MQGALDGGTSAAPRARSPGLLKRQGSQPVDRVQGAEAASPPPSPPPHTALPPTTVPVPPPPRPPQPLALALAQPTFIL